MMLCMLVLNDQSVYRIISLPSYLILLIVFLRYVVLYLGFTSIALDSLWIVGHGAVYHVRASHLEDLATFYCVGDLKEGNKRIFEDQCSLTMIMWKESSCVELIGS